MEESRNEKESSRPIETDDRFAVKVSDSMELRNLLRSGLVEAQGREPEKIPLFVSWPEWLDDGIVCLYASDLHRLMERTVQETAEALSGYIEVDDDGPDESGDR